MTIRDAQKQLTAAGIDPDQAAYEARLLAARYTGCSEAMLLTMRDSPIDVPAFREAVQRRAKREPLQYIFGEWPFMGLSFSVSPDCLIPRADTEILAEEAIRLFPPHAHIADLCTGSGCIGISIAVLRPDISVTAVELYEKTAKIAEHNAVRLGVADRFAVLRGDVTQNCLSSGEKLNGIVANPPYIAWNEMSTLEPELSFEPRAALTDDGDGLSVIHGVFRTAVRHLTDTGWLLMEFGYTQMDAVSALSRQYGFTTRILRDFGGNPRVLVAQKSISTGD